MPRLSLLFLPASYLTMRLGAGYGYKAPSLFISEADEIHFRGVEPIVPSEFDAEESKGMNFDINHHLEIAEGKTLKSNLLLFYTEINNTIQVAEVGEKNVFT